MQELEPDAFVVPHADRDFADVGVERFAEVRDRVDEGDLRGEEGVRGVLDHLGRRRIRDEHRRLHAAVEVRHPDGRRRPFATDDDAIRVEEVLDGLPLAEELGIRRDVDVVVRDARLGEHALHEPRRSHRHGRLVDHDGARAQHGRDLARDGLDEGEVRGPVGPLRRLHTEEHDVGVGRGLGRARDEPEAVRGQTFGDQLGQPLLEDRYLALVEAGDAFLVDVGARDVVAEVRKAGCRGEADVPRADDCDVHGGNVRWRLISSPQAGRCRRLRDWAADRW